MPNIRKYSLAVLNYYKSFGVESHIQNTFDKKRLLENPNPQFCKESNKTVKMFVKDPNIREFYILRE